MEGIQDTYVYIIRNEEKSVVTIVSHHLYCYNTLFSFASTNYYWIVQIHSIWPVFPLISCPHLICVQAVCVFSPELGLFFLAPHI